MLVADVMKPEHTDVEIFPHGAHHIVAHTAGFDEAVIRETFEGAGLKSFSFRRVTSAKMRGHGVHFFLAQGVKRVAQ